MKPIGSRCNVHRKVGLSLGMIVLLAVSFWAGYTLACGRSAARTPSGAIELHYDLETGWFELWQNGVLAAEWTATELGIENVPDPEGWDQRFFWISLDDVKPECVGKYAGL